MLYDSIVKTLNYFRLFDFPLTAEELFSNLWQAPEISYENFLGELYSLKNQGKIVEKFSYYFLPGDEAIVEKRRESVPLVEAKLRIAVKAAKLIRSVPFVKAIFVCNSVAAEAVDKNSDIDFFIITSAKRAWIVRFFTNLILFTFGLRRHGDQVADRVCLSFYVDSEHLDLQPLLIADDIYFTYWLKQLLPLYDPENFHQKLLDRNVWHKKFIKIESSIPKIADGRIGKVWKNIWELFWRGRYGDLIERQFEKVQMDRIKISGQDKVRPAASAVVTTAGVLKFHECDARQEIRDKWLEKLKI